MTHLDEGVLLTLRDAGTGPGLDEARNHLEGCDACRSALRALEERHGRLSRALEHLDVPFDVAAARRRVGARMEGTVAPSGGRGLEADAPLRLGRRRRLRLTHLARAAGLVLLTAAGLSALPGSPLRTWFAARYGGAEAPAEPVPAPRGAEVSAPGAAPDGTGIRVTVQPPVEVRVDGAAPGQRVTVLWSAGGEVAVFAAGESRFRSGASVVEAVVSDGPVRVELPRRATPLTLRVNGRTWIEVGPEGPVYRVEPLAEDGPRVEFRVPSGGP